MNALALSCLAGGIVANAGLVWIAKWNDLRGSDATSFTFALFAWASLIMLAWSAAAGNAMQTLANPFALALGALAGLLSAIAFVCFTSAFHYGHTGLSATVQSFAIAVPVAVGLLAFGEAPGQPQVAALALIFLSLLIVLGYRYRQERRQAAAMPGTKEWIERILLATLFDGLCIAVIGLWSRWVPDADRNLLSACYYVAGAVFLAGVLLAGGRRVSRGCWQRGAAAAIASAIGVSTLALGVSIPGVLISLFVPATVIGYTVLAMIGAQLVFRERAASIEWLGAALGMAGVFILGMSGG